MSKFVLLCDYGLDDAVATAFLLDHRKKGDTVDILPIGGNSEVGVAHRNAYTLLGSYEGDMSGVRIVDTRAVCQPWAKLPSIHGEDGLGDILEQTQGDVPSLSYDEWLAERGKFTLVSLGPCTLTRDILLRRGEDAELLLIMGGCVSETPNFNGYEFNHCLDRDAFAFCVKFPHAVATLDTCRVPEFNYAGRRFDGSSLFARLANRSIVLAEARHKDNCYIYDYIAVQYLFYPDRFRLVTVTDPDGNTLSEIRTK